MTAFTAAVRQRLGVPDANASAEVLIAALDEALAEVRADRAERIPPAPAPRPDGISIPAAEHAQLVADATAGHDARAEVINGRRDRIVDEAIRAGKIIPAQRAQWRASADVDESGTRNLLNTFKQTVPLAELGHSDTLRNSQDSLYASAWGNDQEENHS